MPQSTAKIRKIEDKEGVQFFPITHEQAVIDSNGVSLAQKISNIQTEIGDIETLLSEL